jgi:hypothetical protein
MARTYPTAEVLFLDGLYRFMQAHPALSQAAWEAVSTVASESAPEVAVADTTGLTWESLDECLRWAMATDAPSPARDNLAPTRALPLTGSRWDLAPAPLTDIDAPVAPGVGERSASEEMLAALVDSAVWPARLALAIRSSSGKKPHIVVPRALGAVPPTAFVTVYLGAEKIVTAACAMAFVRRSRPRATVSIRPS